MTKKTSQRGPAMDVLRDIAAKLGVDLADEMDGDSWYSPITDAISALKTSAKVEEIVDSAGTEEPVDAEARAALRAAVKDKTLSKRTRRLAALGVAYCRARRAEDLTPEEMEEIAEELVEFGADVLGKPDAEPDEIVAELVARKEEIAEALSEDAPPPEEEPSEASAESDDEEDEDEREGDEDEDEEKKDDKGARARKLSRERDELRSQVASLNERVALFETREWLDEQLAKRSMNLPKSDRDDLIQDALKHGREIVVKILKARNRPPTGDPLKSEGAQPSGPTPLQVRDAVKLVRDEAREQVRSTHPNANGGAFENLVTATAHQMARNRWPDLFRRDGANAAR